MFTRTSRTDRAKAQVQDATSTASQHLRDKVAPAVGAKARDAKQWATPYAERGLEAAAPKVEAAVERVSPVVDAARDKLVEDLLPRLVEAVNAAAAAGRSATSEAAETARTRGSDAVAVLRGEAVVKPRRRKSRVLLVLAGLAAAGAAAFAVFKRQAPADDPWAVPTGSYPTPVPSSYDTVSAAAPGSALDAGATPGSTEAELPELTADSAAAADAITEAADDAPSTGDPLTDPIEQVEGAKPKPKP